MHRFFGRATPKDPPPNIDDCIAGIESRASTARKKVDKLDIELKKVKDQLNSLREGPAKEEVKKKAMSLIRQRRMYDQQACTLRQQAFNMEQVHYATDTLRDTRATVIAMKDGVKQMKKEYKDISVDEIEDMQDDLADMMDRTEEIQEMMGRTYGVPEIDEDELAAELDALGSDLATDGDASYLDDAITAPNAPDKEPGAASVTFKDGILVDEFGLPQIPAS